LLPFPILNAPYSLLSDQYDSCDLQIVRHFIAPFKDLIFFGIFGIAASESILSISGFKRFHLRLADSQALTLTSLYHPAILYQV